MVDGIARLHGAVSQHKDVLGVAMEAQSKVKQDLDKI